ncbi:MAG: hypothetical protein R6X17_08985 [Candidatus Competibacteraceae bacterium]
MERIRHGLQHYHPRTVDAGELLTQLYTHYQPELPEMAYTIDDFRRDTRQLLLDPDIRQLMLDLTSSTEDHLRGLEPEDILELDPETIRRLVLDAIDSHPRNAPWELMKRIRHGLQHYHPRTGAAGEFLTPTIPPLPPGDSRDGLHA